MTTTTLRTMIAVAALAVAAGSASAQTYRAEVPMAFQAGGKTLAAGSYEVRMGSGAVGQMIVIYSPATKTSAALVSVVRADAPKDWLAAGSPRIRFECAGSACSLRNLWNGSDSFAYQFPAPKRPAGDLVAHRSEVVTLTMIKTR